MDCKKVSRTLEHQEHTKNMFEFNSVVKKNEYAMQIEMEERGRRRRLYITFKGKRYEPANYCMGFKLNEEILSLSKNEELGQYEIFHFVLVNRYNAILKMKKYGEEVIFFSSHNVINKLSLFSIWAIFGEEREFQIAITKFMSNQTEIFLYIRESEEFNGNSPVSRIAQIVYDGIKLEGKNEYGVK